MEPKTGKRFVSKGEYAKVQMNWDSLSLSVCGLLALQCWLNLLPVRCVAQATFDRNQYLIREHGDKQPARTVNSTREDALILDTTLEALLKFPALRAKLPNESHASKMIFAVDGFCDGFLQVFGKYNKHPGAVFMDYRFEKTVTEDILNDLDRRNAGTTSRSKYKPGSPNIVAMSNEEVSKTYRKNAFFGDPLWHQNNPDFLGIIATSLPGYSRRRSTAVVRFSYQPVDHICLGSCLLIKMNRKWSVQRLEITEIL